MPSHYDIIFSKYFLKNIAKSHHVVHQYHLWDWYIDGLVQDCSNSIAYALELLQSCTKP